MLLVPAGMNDYTKTKPPVKLEEAPCTWKRSIKVDPRPTRFGLTGIHNWPPSESPENVTNVSKRVENPESVNFAWKIRRKA
jgi:hypothetical protein